MHPVHPVNPVKETFSQSLRNTRKARKWEQIVFKEYSYRAKDRKKFTIIGESRSQLSKNDVNDFIRKKLSRFEGLFKEIFPVVVTDMKPTTPKTTSTRRVYGSTIRCLIDCLPELIVVYFASSGASIWSLAFAELT